MYIYDINNNEKIIITIETKQYTQELSAKVLFSSPKGNCIFIQFLNTEDVNISLYDKIQVSIVYIHKKNPIIFHNCILQYIQYQNSYYYMITSNSIGMNRNRRNGIRIPLSEQCKIKIGNRLYDAVMQNISINGFAFKTEVDIYDRLNPVIVHYHDSITDDNIKLAGHIVRVKNEQNNQILYGCRMNFRNAIDEYIAIRQRKTK